MPFYDSREVNVSGGGFNDVVNDFIARNSKGKPEGTVNTGDTLNDGANIPHTHHEGRGVPSQNKDAFRDAIVGGKKNTNPVDVDVQDNQMHDLHDLAGKLSVLRAEIQAKRAAHRTSQRDRVAAELAGAQAELAQLSDEREDLQ